MQHRAHQHRGAANVPVNPAKKVISVTLPDVGDSVAPATTGLHIFALALGA